MASLRSALDRLASEFAASVLSAIRGASLHELVADGGGARRGPGRPPKPTTTTGESKPTPKSRPVRTTTSGRLKRRSPEDIAKALEQIVVLVKKSKDGLRAEEIRANLGMASKEMPRVLKEGLAKKKLKAKGQKRATTYTAS